MDGCHNCKFVGRQAGEGGTALICCYDPPTLVSFPNGFGSQFPPVQPNMKCHKHEVGSRVAIARTVPTADEVSKLL